MEKSEIIDKFFYTDPVGRKYTGRNGVDSEGRNYDDPVPGNRMDGSSVKRLYDFGRIVNFIYRKDNKTIQSE